MPERLRLLDMNQSLTESSKAKENRVVAIEAGNFLKASGISDAMVDFRQAFLGDMGELRNEIEISDEDYGSSASLVLEWIAPDDLRHLMLRVTVGRSDHKEKYISASIKEVKHYKGKKYDNNLHEIYLLPLSEGFNFKSQVTRNEKVKYKRWLRDKILNYKAIWGEIDS